MTKRSATQLEEQSTADATPTVTMTANQIRVKVALPRSFNRKPNGNNASTTGASVTTTTITKTTTTDGTDELRKITTDLIIPKRVTAKSVDGTTSIKDIPPVKPIKNQKVEPLEDSVEDSDDDDAQLAEGETIIDEKMEEDVSASSDEDEDEEEKAMTKRDEETKKKNVQIHTHLYNSDGSHDESSSDDDSDPPVQHILSLEEILATPISTELPHLLLVKLEFDELSDSIWTLIRIPTMAVLQENDKGKTTLTEFLLKAFIAYGKKSGNINAMDTEGVDPESYLSSVRALLLGCFCIFGEPNNRVWVDDVLRAEEDCNYSVCINNVVKSFLDKKVESDQLSIGLREQFKADPFTMLVTLFDKERIKGQEWTVITDDVEDTLQDLTTQIHHVVFVIQE